jgi:hypothetical protein
MFILILNEIRLLAKEIVGETYRRTKENDAIVCINLKKRLKTTRYVPWSATYKIALSITTHCLPT